MFSAVKRIFFEGEFNRNVLTLVTGTGLAQLIPLAATPLLARVYLPEQFGVFALFIAVTSSLAVIATGRFELAIMLPRKDVDAANIGAMSVAINLAVSLVLLVMAWLLNGPVCTLLGNRAISPWLYLVPLAVLLNGVYLNLNYWSNRNKLYALMANRRVIQSGGTAAAQLGLGAAGAGAGGLVIGNLAGQALAAAMMARMVHRHNRQLWRCLDHRKMLALARRYRNCAQLLVPAHTLGALSAQLPAIFINATFGLAAAGSYMLAERVAGMPMSLVSGSIADVFRQQISECYLAGKNCRREFLTTLKKLVLVAAPPFLVLLLCAPSLFALLLGAKWRVAGEYAQLLCPMFFLRFIMNPLSVIAIIAQKNRYELTWQAGMLAGLGLAALSHYFVRFGPKEFLAVIAIVYSMFDLAYIVASYRFACDRDAQGQGRASP